MVEVTVGGDETTKDAGGSPGSAATNVIRWEKFLPKMVLRVLLVEPDDSTRQIITLLLRKCNYKVATVSDGLKAWELLNGKPHSIDLILTEVELPSISGFALLSLITEHEVCKNIPVIMMSPHDSVSTVYKCMLRGAADFLVKPVRKNELNNLWQHVWRRQASTSDRKRPHEESEAQQVEATAENNATSNRSSGYMACIKHNGENIEKGSDAQSSCTKPDVDVEGSHMATDIRLERIDANLATGNPSKEVIDLIRSFNSFPESSYRRSSSNHGSNKVHHPSSMFGLSLRSHPSGPVNQISDEKHRLKQSDVSAFSRYINRTQQPLNCISNQQKDYETNSDNPLPKHTIDNNSDTHSTPMGSSQQNMISQHGQDGSQSQFPLPKKRVFPVPVAVRGLRFENPSATYGSVWPPFFCIRPGLLPMQSPDSSAHQEPSSFQANPYYMSVPEARSGCQDLHNLTVDRPATEQTENMQGRNMETLEDRHFSSPTDHSASSGFCNNSIGSGSNGHVNLVGDANNTRLSIQREAALNKFRMKRKDRCYDKKVRYESRKKLAEQRPRVKGQFARQVQTINTSTVEAGVECGN